MGTDERGTETVSPPRAAPRHPLDPLSGAEIAAAGAIVRQQAVRQQAQLGDEARFVLIALQEPSKETLRAFRPGDPIARRAFAVVLDRATTTTFEAVVDLNAGELEAWHERPGVQPFPLLEEFEEAAAITRADERWQAALRRRGVTDFDTVQIDPWPAGHFGAPAEQGRRLLRAVSYLRVQPNSNGYARPIEGVVAVVDLGARQVVELIDQGDAPIPQADGRFDPETVGPLRSDRRPLEIHQPQGLSFVLDGHALRWQKWRLRVSLHPREGLVLHTIGYEDNGELRSICHRASLAEMAVPYGDASPGQYFKNAFDSGELGAGRLTNSLVLGCDCLGEIVYLDAVVNDDHGRPRTIKNAICIHEEDYGVLWKHTDHLHPDQVEVRRSRRLVVSSFVTVGNYDYGFYWYFYEDGSFGHEVKATGIVQTQAVTDDEELETKQLVAKNLAAPIHQHFFCFRLDMDVDGSANRVYEVESEPLPPGPTNPYGNAFRPHARLLPCEREAQRTVNAAAGRFWQVVNPSRTNAWGQPVAYALLPGETVSLMAGEDSAAGRRTAFARKQLWVTQFAAEERYPAGDYPAQSPGGEGLPAWTAANRSLQDEDVVLWYTVGFTHIVRPEDWPITPVHRAGFLLNPWGFFDRNPALDVAPQPHACHR